MTLLGQHHATAASSLAPDPDVRAGVRAMSVVAIGYLPFGLLVGAAVAASDRPLAAWLATFAIYGGAAHLAVLDLLGGGAGWSTAAAVGILVNVRLTAYATAMSAQWRGQPARLRLLAALVLSDAPWAMARAHGGDDAAQRRFYLGAALCLLVAYPSFVTAGLVAGEWLEGVPATHLLPALTLGTLAVHQLRDRPAVAAGAASLVTALATTGLPSGPALALCAAAAAVAATVAAASCDPTPRDGVS